MLLPTFLTLLQSRSSQGEGLLAIPVVAAMSSTSPDHELIMAQADHVSSVLSFLCIVFPMSHRCFYPTSSNRYCSDIASV